MAGLFLRPKNFIKLLIFDRMEVLTCYSQMSLFISEYKSFTEVQHVHSAHVFKAQFFVTYNELILITMYFACSQVFSAVIREHLVHHHISIRKYRSFAAKSFYILASLILRPDAPVINAVEPEPLSLEESLRCLPPGLSAFCAAESVIVCLH